ncbi:MAG TPA: histidine phosphatase family protein [Mycobacteriales bacterium]|nr:histidine phosphatase family protein [Mycobacteriales bacterium]
MTGSPPLVVLLRHGDTEWSVAGQHTGRTDVPLLDTGRDAARSLQPLLTGVRFAQVLSSPLSRARETAELAGLTVNGFDDDLREWDYGEYEGITTEQIRRTRPGWDIWTDGCPGGEDADAVAARCGRVLDRIAGVDGPVALVAHGHLLRALAARWCGLGAAQGGALHLDTATLSLLGWDRERPVVRRWNARQPVEVP